VYSDSSQKKNKKKSSLCEMARCEEKDPSKIHLGNPIYYPGNDGKVLALGPDALSDNVLRMGYYEGKTEALSELVVQFRSRRSSRYRYFGVPKALWDRAITTPHPWSDVLWPALKYLKCLVKREVRPGDRYFYFDCPDAEGPVLDRPLTKEEMIQIQKKRDARSRRGGRRRDAKNRRLEYERKERALRVRQRRKDAKLLGAMHSRRKRELVVELGPPANETLKYTGVSSDAWNKALDSGDPWAEVLWGVVGDTLPSRVTGKSKKVTHLVGADGRLLDEEGRKKRIAMTWM
jgi:hypothetical protein